LSVVIVTNGGKTTLAEKLKKLLPNCDTISQDDFFKVMVLMERSDMWKWT
uniref:Uncharacterized protein n=1 Tax=Pavo cristatus TaxID=9049 RepID=A0A8C9FAL2_PAVCR